MKGKPQDCSGCPGFRSKRFSGFVPDELNPGAQVTILGDFPQRAEVFNRDGPKGYGRPFVGGVGRLLEKLLPPGRTRRDLNICNVIRCHPAGDLYPIGEVRWLMEDLCSRRHGSEHAALTKATVVGVTWHPSFVLPVKQKVPQAQPFVRRALEAAFTLAAAGESPVLCMGDKAFRLMMPHMRGGVKKWQRGWWRV